MREFTISYHNIISFDVILSILGFVLRKLFEFIRKNALNRKVN